MNVKLLIIALVLILAAAGCSKDSPTAPPSDTSWTFPSSGKFAVTLYADKTTISVGQTTDVKLILYNVTGVFGAAADILMPLDSLDVTQVLAGPSFLPSSENPLIVYAVDSTAGKVSYGATLRAPSTATFSGSAVVCKATVRGVIPGVAHLRLNPLTLELLKADGQPISNFGSIALEDLTITVQ
jgi:hypothetical protein